MIETHLPAPEKLRMDAIQELVRSHGPCVTLLLPSYRPGEQAKSMAVLIRSKLKDAAQQLGDRKVAASVRADLLDPLEQLAEDPESQKGFHWGRVLFSAPGVFRSFQLIEPASVSLTVGGYFQIRPILASLHLPPEFYVLQLSKKRFDVLRCAGLDTEPVKLNGVPETLDEAMAFKPPDHDLENRSSAGPSTGSMRGVRFGTGSGRETEHTHLADFYKLVDRGLHALSKAAVAPVVLAGVDQDAVLYRAVSKYPNLLEQNIHGSPGGALPEHEILRQAYTLVRLHCVKRQEKALAEAKERLAPARFASGMNTILRAAVEGRVTSLYIDEAARMSGVLEAIKRGERWTRGEEDLLNAAAVETILQGGEVFELPAGSLPDGAAVTAILRY